MRVELRPQAEDEIDRAAARYEREGPGLGTSFTHAVLSALSAIGEQPSAYTCAGRNARRFVMRRFPHVVIYREERNAVVVYACIHGHRDPAHWRRRL